jgi:hypothetical protein
MAMKVNLGILEMDLEKIGKLIVEMLSVNVDETSKNEVKELVEEVSKAYEDLVDCYVDFKPLRKNSEVFENSFSQLYVKFEKTYLKSPVDKSASCGKIHSALNRISKNRWYLTKLPMLSKKIEEFKLSSDAWYLNDTLMVEILSEFNKRVYQDLREIEKTYGNEPTETSRDKLNVFILKWDEEFLNLRSKISEFRNLSSNIQ